MVRTYSTKTYKVAFTSSVLPEDGQGCGVWLSQAEGDFVPMTMMTLSNPAVRLQRSLLLYLQTDLRAL